MTPSSVDLDPRTRQALDFDELLAWVADFARTAPGRERVLATAPTATPDVLEETLAALREVQLHLDTDGALVPSGLPDPLEALAILPIPGRALGAPSLHRLASVARAVGELGAALRRLDAEAYPRLRGRAQALPDLRGEAELVLRHVAPDGTIADSASAELARVRRALARTGERLRGMLESFLRRADAQAVIRDDFITQRNGRFVIPVRSDSPHAVSGIVHASSSSGATRFVEPLETVELNNELVRLGEAELRETERLLAGWSESFRARLEAVDRVVAGLGELDALQARALFAREITGVLPAVAERGGLRLADLRHPLLDRRLRESGRRSVPLSIALDPFDRVLVLSGPNAGGKTVSLKTVGLAALMAQSAIPLPASEARLPVYRQLRADVGDHQSMQADLSTFTAHVGAMAGFLAGADPPLLLLLDEIGSGTDPAEGAALACAMLEELRRPGVTVVATTHQGAVKAWAATTEGASGAALEFDTERLRPTYRVIQGAAGISAGLEIAERVGLDPRIVERARGRLGAAGDRVERFLNRLHELRRELEREAEALEAERLRLAEQQREAERRIARELERERRRDAERIEAAIVELRRDAERELRRLGAEAEKERRRVERDLAQAATRARHAAARREEHEPPAGELPERLEPGMRVRVRSLGREGAIERIAGGAVVVRVGNVPVTVRRPDLGPASGAAPAAPRRRPQVAPRSGPRGSETLDDRPSELRLIGKTVEEALAELDKFLDEASLAGLQEVRLIHGHGTGRLRRAVRDFLRGHVHVQAQRAGNDHEGGDGATIVTLK